MCKYKEVNAQKLASNLNKTAPLGLEIIIPDDRTLTIDFDTPELPADFAARRQLMELYYPVESEKTTTSKSGNLHVYLVMKDSFTHTEKVALQAALGSDPKRVILGLVRAKSGDLGEPSLFFETLPAAAGETFWQ